MVMPMKAIVFQRFFDKFEPFRSDDCFDQFHDDLSGLASFFVLWYTRANPLFHAGDLQPGRLSVLRREYRLSCMLNQPADGRRHLHTGP
jgi:hypothetical protein